MYFCHNFSIPVVRGLKLSCRFCHFISDRRVSSDLGETQTRRFGHMMHEAAIGTDKRLYDFRTFGDVEVLMSCLWHMNTQAIHTSESRAVFCWGRIHNLQFVNNGPQFSKSLNLKANSMLNARWGSLSLPCHSFTFTLSPTRHRQMLENTKYISIQDSCCPICSCLFPGSGKL